ncbi:F-box/kelch-repeat protein At5g15710-like [Juglans microcarpa x Juglans regia]|uniref:F-box/kelch-repeat protein At5g15710-like n=1 Tax=Juglans microcarpa x Juglans regia TaxID=2249226 RepID=UPI001B7F443A|nr:F-box/kelch-repeat protein At5g15710-like [Juglans microcarpa x Juglans regia]
MWSDLPSDLLSNIFSYLSPDSLARARSTCRHWHAGAKAYLLTTIPPVPWDEPPWFLAMPMRNRNHRLSCYAHNPVLNNWHALSLHFLPDPVRLVGPIGSLVLIRPTNSTFLQLAICNPFSRQFRHLPLLNTTRTNPAVGVLVLDSSQDVPFPCFRVYVAGGMSEAPRGGAMYEPTLEMYDSRHDRWQIVGSMPVEFAVRLTVWTPNESVYSKGFLYWITSARAYCVMGFEIGTNTWRELNVPMADRLEFATLVRRNGVLTLVGGTCGQPACIWELGEGDEWGLVEKMPAELETRFLGGKGSWGSTKCVGSDEAIYLYRCLGSGMAVWREVVDKGRWEWFWVEGCCSIGGKRVQSFPIKGVLLHPSLASSSIIETTSTENND